MIFQTIEEIKQYVTISGGLDITSLQPDLNRVEKQLLPKFLGEQLDEVTAEYALANYDVEEMEGRLKDLLLQIRPAAALLALFRFAPLNSIQISDSGYQMVSTADFKQAFQWMKDDAVGYLAQYGYAAIDDCLRFLEVNKEDYPLWAEDSAVYTVNKQYLVNDAVTYNKHFNINESRLTFIALLPMISRAETFTIAPAISAALYAEIKAEILSNDLSEDNLALMQWLQPALCLYAMERALAILPLVVSGNGVYLNHYKAIQGEGQKEKQPAPGGDKRNLAEQCKKDADTYMALCLDYLNATASSTKYAAFYNSPLYKGTGTKTIPFKNTSEQKNIGLF